LGLDLVDLAGEVGGFHFVDFALDLSNAIVGEEVGFEDALSWCLGDVVDASAAAIWAGAVADGFSGRVKKFNRSDTRATSL